MMTIVNTGAGPLTITAATTQGCTQFTVNPPLNLPKTLNECDTTDFSVIYSPPQPADPHALSLPVGSVTTEQCHVILTTNAGTKELALSGSIQ
jgi:hypothetical protein